MKKSLLILLYVTCAFSVSHAQTLLLTEDMETDDEGVNYTSNTFNDGGGDVWVRWNIASSPAGPNSTTQTSGANFFQAYSGWQGSFAWGGEDFDAPDNPLGTGESGYFVLKTLDVSAYQGGEISFEALLGGSTELNSRYEANDRVFFQYAFDSNIATGANSVNGLPSSANVGTGTYSNFAAFYGGTGASSSDLTIDADLNGSGDIGGSTLNTTLTDYAFAFDVPPTATNLSIRVNVLAGSAEELVFDNIRVSGIVGTPSPGSWDGSTSTDWNDASNWTGNAVPTAVDDITIPSAPSNQPHVTLDPANPAVCNNITIESGATLTIDAGKALTVSGDTENEGTILVEADATGIGSFIDNGTITGSGSFQMEQYLTGSGGGTPNGFFYYVSSPIPNATASDYSVASGNRLWIDDEVNTEYPELTFGAIPLEVGQGYIARMGATGAITFDGSSYNTGNITEGGLTRTGTIDLNRGYNLVGNPYPSTVNWDDLGRTNLETTMWYRTNNGGTMTFDTYNATGMVGTNNNGGGTVDGTIPPTQAFWVRVDADGNTGSVSFENADRTHGTLAGIYKAESEEGTIRLSLSNGTIGDEQVIYFDASANDAFDDYDSRKFWASGIPQLYSNIQGDTLTINGLNSPQTTQMVPLGIKIPSQGNYSLDAVYITLVSTPAILEDTYLNVFQDLNAVPNYNFTSDAGNIGDRFILHFNNAMVGVEEESEVKSQVFAASGQLNISLAPNVENANLLVLDMAGRTIATRALDQTQTVLDMNVPTGIYLIRIQTAKGTDTHKVIFN